MRVLVTVPCPIVVFSKHVQTWIDFCRSEKFTVELRLERTPNRMDKSISACIELAKTLRPAWWVRLDADVRPQGSIDEFLMLAQQNWNDHGAISGCPTMNERGTIQCKAVDPNGYTSEEPFECEYVSGSLVFVPQPVYDALKPVRVVEDGRGGKMNYYIALQRPETTEDWDFCERVRAAGYRVMADPAIVAEQRRDDLGIPSFRRGMSVGARVFVPTNRDASP